MTNSYYVYYYLRNRNSEVAPKGAPYYVGKGVRNRITAKHGKIKVPKNPQFRVKIAENLTEAEAYELEKFHIKLWGRKDIGTGILLNQTDGGKGSAGNRHPCKLQCLIKINARRKGSTLSLSHKNKISQSLKDLYAAGKLPVRHQFTTEQRFKISMSLKSWRQSLSAEQRLVISSNISKALKGKKYKHNPETFNATRAKRSAQMLGKRLCPYTRKWIPQEEYEKLIIQTKN